MVLKKLSGLFCAAFVLASVPAMAAQPISNTAPARVAAAPTLQLESKSSADDVRSYQERETKSAKEVKELENFKGGNPAVIVVPVGVVVLTVVLLLVLL